MKLQHANELYFNKKGWVFLFFFFYKQLRSNHSNPVSGVSLLDQNHSMPSGKNIFVHIYVLVPPSKSLHSKIDKNKEWLQWEQCLHYTLEKGNKKLVLPYTESQTSLLSLWLSLYIKMPICSQRH